MTLSASPFFRPNPQTRDLNCKVWVPYRTTRGRLNNRAPRTEDPAAAPGDAGTCACTWAVRQVAWGNDSGSSRERPNPPPPPGFHPSSIGAPSRRGCIAVPEEAFPLHRVCALRDLLNGAGIQKTQAVGLALPLTRWVAPTSAGPRVPHVRTSPCPSFLSSQQAREVLGPPPSPPVTLTFLRQGSVVCAGSARPATQRALGRCSWLD